MRRATLLALALLMPLPAMAQGVLYDCDITELRENVGWVPEKIGIVVDEGGAVTVIDPLIMHFNKEPMQARVSRNTADRLDIRWTLRNVTGGSNQTVDFFDYQVQINKNTNRIGVWAKPDNFQNRFTGKGNCTPRTR